MSIDPRYERHRLAGDWVYAHESRDTAHHNLRVWTEGYPRAQKVFRRAERALVEYLKTPGNPEVVVFHDVRRRVHTLRIGPDGRIVRTIQEETKTATDAVLDSLGLIDAPPAHQIAMLARVIERYRSGELTPANVDDFDPVNHFHLIDDPEPETPSDG